MADSIPGTIFLYLPIADPGGASRLILLWPSHFYLKIDICSFDSFNSPFYLDDVYLHVSFGYPRIGTIGPLLRRVEIQVAPGIDTFHHIPFLPKSRIHHDVYQIHIYQTSQIIYAYHAVPFLTLFLFSCPPTYQLGLETILHTASVHFVADALTRLRAIRICISFLLLLCQPDGRASLHSFSLHQNSPDQLSSGRTFSPISLIRGFRGKIRPFLHRFDIWIPTQQFPIRVEDR